MGGFLLFVSVVGFLWACVGLIHPPTARLPNRGGSVLIISFVSFVIFAIGSGMMEEEVPDRSAPSSQVTTTVRCDPYPSDIEAIVVESIMQDVLVHDAALSQSACGLSLVLMVNAAITEASAHERGERFVRQVKGLGPKGAQDEPLGAEIGRSQYDYTIGVYASGTQEPIARGTKISMARRIRW